MNGFLRFFKNFGAVLISPSAAAVAQQSGAIVGGFNPGIGALIETIAGAAQLVESQAAAAAAAGAALPTGAQKKEQVKAILDVAAPVTLQVLGAVAGKPVTNPQAIAPTLDKLIDLSVELMNELDIFRHSQPVQAPVLPASLNAGVQLGSPLV